MNKKEERNATDHDHKLDDKEIAKALRNRDRAVKELIETEKTYVNGLGKLIIIYMNPLKQNDYKIISISDHQTIFPSVVTTIYNLHNQLLAELDYNYYEKDNIVQNESITARVGKVLIKYVELFKMYQIYMNGYERAIKALHIIRKKNKKFNRWLDSQFAKTCISAGDLENLLILPIQRIPRYQLLLAQIIKQTEKISIHHGDLDDLRHTYTQINQITKLIEAKMRQYDNKHKVALIEKKFTNISAGDLVQPSRCYITESTNKSNKSCIKIYYHDGTSHHIVLFLFNDCLIYGHYLSNIAYEELYFDHLLMFDNLFKCICEDNYVTAKYCLKIYSRQYSVWISFKTKKMRTKWLKLINNANTLHNNKYIVNLQRFNEANKTKTKGKLKAQRKQMLAYPCFVPDDYTNYCQECNAKFTYISNRKHHCKQCGRLLCKLCTNYKINCVFFNKNNKNKIIRCCKKCKHNNTFSSTLNNNNNIKQNNNTIQCEQYDKYDHGYNRHVQIYNQISTNNTNINRIGRTNSTPSIQSPPLKPLKKRFSTPLVINSSHTSVIETSRSKSCTKAKQTLFTASKSLQILRHSHKFSDKMPRSPQLKAPQQQQLQGYDNENDGDDSCDDEIDGGDKSRSVSIDEMPMLDITQSSNTKEIKVLKSRRSRSNAIGLINECYVSTYVGCVITDDETDENTSFIDQLLLSSCSSGGGDIASSAECNKDSPFVKKEKIQQRVSSFRANNININIVKYETPKSLTWL